MAISHNALRAQARARAAQAREPDPPPPDLPLTPLHLAAVEALRLRDGLTRAGALTRVRALDAAELQSLAGDSSPHAPREEPPKLEQKVTEETKVEAEASAPSLPSFPSVEFFEPDLEP
jgi:hypothetical protein